MLPARIPASAPTVGADRRLVGLLRQGAQRKGEAQREQGRQEAAARHGSVSGAGASAGLGFLAVPLTTCCIIRYTPLVQPKPTTFSL